MPTEPVPIEPNADSRLRDWLSRSLPALHVKVGVADDAEALEVVADHELIGHAHAAVEQRRRPKVSSADR